MEGRVESIDIRGALAILRRRAVLIVLCVLVVGGSAFAFSTLQEKRYSATASLLFRDPGFDQRIFGAPIFESAADPEREAATNVRLVSLDIVAERTAKALADGTTGDDISAAVDVEAEGQSDVVSVTAETADPRRSADVANTFAREYIEFRRKADRAKIKESRELVEADLERLGPEEQTSEEAQSLQTQISDLRTLEALQTGNAELVEKATPPESQSSPKLLRNTLVGILFGLFVGLAIALLRERLDRKLRDSDDLEHAFGLPVLGGVPNSPELGGDTPARGDLSFSEAESFRLLRTRLRYFNVDRDLRSILITSPSPSEGKSVISWNLARTAAEAGTTTLLIEADFHQPTVAARYQLEPLPGLAELLTHQVSLERAIQAIEVDSRTNGASVTRQLQVITAGATPPNPVELMESEGMAKLLAELGQSFELIVIDTPPVSVLADAIPLMKLVSGVIIVGEMGKTTRDDAADLREQLKNLGAPVLGVVANKASKARSYRYGYYGRKSEDASRFPIRTRS